MSQSLLNPSQVPDFVEAFTAYRAWHWEDGVVKSLNGAVWTPRQAMAATCPNNASLTDDVEWNDILEEWERHMHVPPVESCSCGIYAGKNFEHLVEINYANFGIHGEVSLWGKLMECTLGYRAQFAYPRYFVVPPAMVCGAMSTIEFRIQTLASFEVPIYLGEPGEVTKESKKLLLHTPGVGYSEEGIQYVLSDVQKSYTKMMRRIRRDPEKGEKLAIKGKGISVIRSVNKNEVEAMLYNTLICTVPRKDVIWNAEYMRFECEPSSFRIRGAK